MPKTRQAFWRAKFLGNVMRDRRNRKVLEAAGWRVKVVWECEVMRDPHAVLDELLQWLGARHRLIYDAIPERKVLLKVAEERLQWGLDGMK